VHEPIRVPWVSLPAFDLAEPRALVLIVDVTEAPGIANGTEPINGGKTAVDRAPDPEMARGRFTAVETPGLGNAPERTANAAEPTVVEAVNGEADARVVANVHRRGEWEEEND
jgi:hypothetical protein